MGRVSLLEPLSQCLSLSCLTWYGRIVSLVHQKGNRSDLFELGRRREPKKKKIDVSGIPYSPFRRIITFITDWWPHSFFPSAWPPRNRCRGPGRGRNGGIEKKKARLSGSFPKWKCRHWTPALYFQMSRKGFLVLTSSGGTFPSSQSSWQAIGRGSQGHLNPLLQSIWTITEMGLQGLHRP